MRHLAPVIFLLGMALYACGQNQQRIPSPSEAELAKMLGGADVIRAVQNAQRVEAVLVKVDEGKSQGWLRWQVIEPGKRFDLPVKDADRAKSLLTDRETYLDGEDACVFDPGVKLIFHDPGISDITLLLCLKCNDVAVVRDGKQIGYASFYPGEAMVMNFARTIFPNDKGIRFIDEERSASIKKREEERKCWLSGMPKSIQPIWNSADERGASINPNVEPFRAPLAKEFPDRSKRILALLTWYGSGAGPWSGFPIYEIFAESLLFDFTTPEIIDAIQANKLTDRQIEGAARFFGDWDFSRRRPGDLKLLPASLKKTLLENSLQGGDEDKAARAKHAFQ